jgi:hypothetical protein
MPLQLHLATDLSRRQIKALAILTRHAGRAPLLDEPLVGFAAEALTDALVEAERLLGIDLDVDDAFASNTVRGWLALVERAPQRPAEDPAGVERERLAIAGEAARLGVPAFLTPAWQRAHAAPAAAERVIDLCARRSQLYDFTAYRAARDDAAGPAPLSPEAPAPLAEADLAIPPPPPGPPWAFAPTAPAAAFDGAHLLASALGLAGLLFAVWVLAQVRP